MAKKTIIVTLGHIQFADGRPCKNPKVELSSNPGVFLNCVDKNACSYEVQLDDFADENCLYLKVTCDTCKKCPSQLVKVCLCETDEDCPDCSKCVDGICVEICPKELCLDDQCVECTTDEQCPCDQICKQGRCVCPKDSDRPKPSGCCGCESDEECGPCEVCRNGECVPKECDGICDPATGECEECIRDGDCELANECCEDRKCVCCPGFVRDQCTGECVPLPPNPCKDNADCDNCSGCKDINPCTGYGSCVSNCPEGFVCVDGACREECDCDDNTSCSQRTDYCKRLDIFTCYCEPCGDVACAQSGAACGATDDARRNCVCQDGTCVAGGCQGSCVRHSDCNGGGGTGCYCLNGQCTENPCSGSCSNSFDCADGCVCSEGICIPGDKGECDTNLVLEKIQEGNNCDLKASLNIDCCPCPLFDITTSGSATAGNSKDFASVFFKEGSRLGDSAGNNKIAGNEEPNFGSISWQTVYENRIETWNTPVPQGTPRVRYETDDNGISGNSNSFNGQIDQLDYTVTEQFVPGQVISEGAIPGGYRRITRSAIGLTVTLNQTTVNGTGCTYDTQVIHEEVFDEVSWFGANVFVANVTSDDCRNPLFIWRKDGQIIRKIYKASQEDTLRGPDAISNDEALELPANEGLLESCHRYSIEVDCDCGGPKEDCIVFCDNIPEFTATPLNPCNTLARVVLGPTCDINQNLKFTITAFFANGGTAVIERIGSELPVNEIMEDESDTTPITRIVAEMECPAGATCVDPCMKEVVFDEINLTPPTISTECRSGVTYASFTGGENVIAVYIDGDTSRNFYETSFPVTVGMITATIVYGVGGVECAREEEIFNTEENNDCCAEVQINITAPAIGQCGTAASVTASVSGGQGPYIWNIDGRTVQGPSITESFTRNNQNISISVEDSLGCSDQDSVTLSCTTIPDDQCPSNAQINGGGNLCPGETTTLTANVNNPDNHSLSYSWSNGSSSRSITVGSGNYSVTIIDTTDPDCGTLSANASVGVSSNCNEPTGDCCLNDNCVQRTAEDCLAQGGVTNCNNCGTTNPCDGVNCGCGDCVNGNCVCSGSCGTNGTCVDSGNSCQCDEPSVSCNHQLSASCNTNTNVVTFNMSNLEVGVEYQYGVSGIGTETFTATSTTETRTFQANAFSTTANLFRSGCSGRNASDSIDCGGGGGFLGQCCEGTACRVVTEDDCSGTWTAGADCSGSNPCGSVDPCEGLSNCGPLTTGMCCCNGNAINKTAACPVVQGSSQTNYNALTCGCDCGECCTGSGNPSDESDIAGCFKLNSACGDFESCGNDCTCS